METTLDYATGKLQHVVYRQSGVFQKQKPGQGLSAWQQSRIPFTLDILPSPRLGSHSEPLLNYTIHLRGQ